MNLELAQVLNGFNRLSHMFEHLDLKHIYRERNSLADGLAKAGALVMDRFWYIKEFRASGIFESYQQFYTCSIDIFGILGVIFHDRYENTFFVTLHSFVKDYQLYIVCLSYEMFV